MIDGAESSEDKKENSLNEPSMLSITLLDGRLAHEQIFRVFWDKKPAVACHHELRVKQLQVVIVDCAREILVPAMGRTLEYVDRETIRP
jgi:hypothetical protein